MQIYITKEDKERALDIGLTEAYKIRSSGYLGSNLEGKIRVGIEAALTYIESIKLDAARLLTDSDE